MTTFTLKKKNEKKKLKNIKIPIKKLQEIKKAAANISKIESYDPAKDYRVKFDASHRCLGATLEQKKWEG